MAKNTKSAQTTRRRGLSDKQINRKAGAGKNVFDGNRCGSGRINAADGTPQRT